LKDYIGAAKKSNIYIGAAKKIENLYRCGEQIQEFLFCVSSRLFSGQFWRDQNFSFQEKALGTRRPSALARGRLAKSPRATRVTRAL